MRSGTFTTNNWLTVNRTNAANPTGGMVLVSGGTLVPTNVAGQFQVNSNIATAALYGVVDVGTGGRILGGNTGNINLNQQANAGNQGIATIHDGGSIQTTSLFAGNATGFAGVNLHGGTLVASNNGTLLGANLDAVVIYPNGGTIDTNGFNTTTGVNALLAPTGSGIASIAFTTGANYIGRPIVKITDATGTGATAVASFNELTGALDGITITSPGSGYTAPTITLIGGGATTAGTIGVVGLTPNSAAGGLTKTGLGTLTISSTANSYGGPTKISGGVLAIPTISPGGANSTLGASSAAAANLVFDGGTLQYTGGSGGTDRSFTINTGKTATIDVTTIATTLTLSGGAAATNGNLTKIGNGTLSLTGTNLHTGTTTVNAGVLAASGSYSGGFAVGGTGRLTALNLGVGALSVPTLTLANSQVGKIYSIANNTTATTIELTINDAVVTEWTNGTANSQWNNTDAANWTAGIPNGNGAVATFAALATPGSVAVTGPKTAGSIVFNNAASYTLTGSTITLNNGLGTPSITTQTGSHTISAPIQLSQNANLVIASGTTLTLGGNISGSGTGLNVVGADLSSTVVLSGTNGYSGATTIRVGTLEIAGGASIGGSSGLVEKNGAKFRINAGGSTTVTQPVTLDIATGAAATATGLVNGTGNFAIEISPGTQATFSGLVSNASGSLVISGGGDLMLTNPGANTLSNVAGPATVLQNGTLTFNGGALATYGVTNGEFTIGDNTPNQVTATLSSGTLNVGTFTSVGRGNGTVGLQSSLNVTGGKLDTGNLFSGFANNVGGYNAEPIINVSGSSIVVARNTGANTGVRIGESAGSKGHLDISNAAQFTTNGEFQIGYGGLGIVTIADTATVSIAKLGVGYGNTAAGNTAAGVVRQTGGNVLQATGLAGDSRIGGFAGVNDSLAYGSYEISNGSFTTNHNFQIGAYGRGVMEISGAATNVSTTGGFPVVGRFAGGVGLLNIKGGSFNETTAGNFLIIGEVGTGVVNVSGSGALNVAATPGAAGNAGGTGGIRLGHAAGGVGVLNLNGGTVTASGIAKSAVAGVAAIYFNGGTVKANANNTTFLQGLDSAIVGSSGAFINTNGFDITIDQALNKPTGSGVSIPNASLAILDGGAGYLGQPIVQIVGDGTGATAVATVNGAGIVTGITVTNPGIGYTSVSAVNLLGGGFTTPATVDLANVTTALNATTGGVTKDGAGTLTLTGAQNYASLTTNAGRTNLNASLSNAAINNVGGILNVNATAYNSDVTVSGRTVFVVDQTLNSLVINNGGVATVGGPAEFDAPAPAPEDFGGAALADAGAAVQGVPEPGGTALLLGGLATLLGLRRRGELQ